MLTSRPRFDSANDQAFSSELRAAVRAYLEKSGDHRYANATTWLKIASLAICVVATYCAALRAGDALAFFGLYVCMHLFAVLLSLNTNHDGSHGALSRRRMVNEVAMRVAALPLGNEPVYWKVRHVRYHHPYANIEHYDLDTAANPFLRQTPFQAWRPWFRFQHLYWPVIAALSLLYINLVYDWSDRLGKTPLASDQPLAGAAGWTAFLMSKVLHLGLFVAVPLVVQGPHIGYGMVLIAWLAGQAIASCVLLTLLLGTHWAETEFFELPADGVLPHGRDEHSFLTCCDWATRPRFIGGWLGGLNHHLTHHLFPGHSHRHCPALADIVESLAVRHGLRYRRLGYVELIASQQRFLKAMGKRPPELSPEPSS